MNDDMIEGELRMGLGRVESAIGDAVDDTEFKLRGKADQVLGQVQNLYGTARMSAEQTIDEVDAFVTERPYFAAAVAAVIGIAFGFVLGVGRPKVIVIRPAPRP